jgi:hypothetical protein
MAAFADSCSAVEWALTLQLALMALPWAPDLVTATLECAAEVLDVPTGQVGSGFRVQKVQGLGFYPDPRCWTCRQGRWAQGLGFTGLGLGVQP